MEEHFDAIVVGSGFGGSVAACRLSEAGKRVCMFERGRPFPPGSFARTPHEMRANVWDPDRGLYGLFDLWSFRNLESIVSAGLGGGSLIYANVLIRKDERWFVRDAAPWEAYEHWPVTRAKLDPFYERAERMLHGQVFPLDQPPFDTTKKTLAMRDAARELGVPVSDRNSYDPTRPAWYLPLLAVSFANEGAAPKVGEALREEVRNLHDVDRQTCRLCGECDIGCNYGAKNTLDLTYLSAAKAHGAEIRTLCEIKSIEPHRAGYRIGYVDHTARSGKHSVMRYASCTKLFVGCGTLGSNYLLLRNRHNLPALSGRLGQRFSGNGDMISFVFGARAGRSNRKGRALDGTRGPVITSTFRLPDALDGDSGRGLYLQDAGYPYFVSWLVEAGDVRSSLHRLIRFVGARVAAMVENAPRSRISRDLSGLIGDARLSTDSLPLLGMGRDTPDGVLSLAADRTGEEWLEIDWHAAASKPYLRRAERFSRNVGRALGGTFVLNPLTRLANNLITVHPLGGVAMSRSANEGVVDEFGEVWGHRGLYVVDGSVMPGPVGANPSLTIAAFAERCVDRIC